MSWRAKMEQKESKPITGKIILAFFGYRTTTAKKDLMCTEDAWKWKSEEHKRKNGVGEI
jgi:hypothetical protein